MRRAGTVTFLIDLAMLVVFVMDDQGGGMYIYESTVSVSQGSYTSCSADYVGRAGVWLVQRALVFQVSSKLLHLQLEQRQHLV